MFCVLMRLYSHSGSHRYLTLSLSVAAFWSHVPSETMAPAVTCLCCRCNPPAPPPVLPQPLAFVTVSHSYLCLLSNGISLCSAQ